MVDSAVCCQFEQDDLRLLRRSDFAFLVGAEDIEVVGEGEGLELFWEGRLGSADVLEGHLIIEVDEVVVFLYDVGVVVGMLVDGFDVVEDGFCFGSDDFHID